MKYEFPKWIHSYFLTFQSYIYLFIIIISDTR